MYYQITFTLDKKIRGRYEMPHTVKLCSKDFLNYIAEKNRNISMYFDNKNDLYENMPNGIIGHILKRKNFVDIMDFTPACLSLKAVISEKVKSIFENLQIDKTEYFLKEITIAGFENKFYLLFVPIIRDSEFVYPKCEFVNMFADSDKKIFKNRQEYYNDKEIYFLQKVTLSSKYQGADLLYPQGSDVFFSERIICAFEREGVIGYDIIKGGCFYSEIDFDTVN